MDSTAETTADDVAAAAVPARRAVTAVDPVALDSCTGVVVITDTGDDDVAHATDAAARLAAGNDVPVLIYDRSEETWGDSQHPDGPLAPDDATPTSPRRSSRSPPTGPSTAWRRAGSDPAGTRAHRRRSGPPAGEPAAGSTRQSTDPTTRTQPRSRQGMEHMETQSEAVRRLQSAGYTANLTIDETGAIVHGEHRWSPAEVTVVELVRFEGMSSPDDEAMLLGVTAPDGSRGTISLPYGPDVSGPTADAIRRLVTSHRSPPRPTATG